MIPPSYQRSWTSAGSETGQANVESRLSGDQSPPQICDAGVICFRSLFPGVIRREDLTMGRARGAGIKWNPRRVIASNPPAAAYAENEPTSIGAGGNLQAQIEAAHHLLVDGCHGKELHGESIGNLCAYDGRGAEAVGSHLDS